MATGVAVVIEDEVVIMEVVDGKQYVLYLLIYLFGVIWLYVHVCGLYCVFW